MNTLQVQIIGMIIMFVGNLSLGLLPMKLVKWLSNAATNHPRFRNMLGLINCFTGGVFLGTCLIHLLPDVTNNFKTTLGGWDIETSFPVAEFTVSVGFFIVLIIESIVSMCHYQHKRERELKIRRQLRSTNHQDYGTYPQASISDTYENQSIDNRNHGNDAGMDLQSNIETVDILRETSVIRAFIFLISLSIHSLLAGIAIGLQTGIDNVIMLFIAVDGHKWIIAFALGLELVQVSLSKCKCVLYMVFFATMSPLGVVIGIFVDTDSSSMLNQETASCFLQACATGTFLYVTFFEVLSKELSNRHDMLRILSVIAGFAVMTGFKFLE